MDWVFDRSQVPLRIRMFGMQRSGNHAFLSWLHSNLPYSNYMFLNNCTPYQSPFKSFCQLEINRQIIRGSKVRHIPYSEFLKRVNDELILTISYENFDPKEREKEKNLSYGLGDHFFDYEFFIIRSFLNWFASLSLLYRLPELNRCKSLEHQEIEIKKAIYKYFECLVSWHDYKAQNSMICVKYDDWVSCEIYRRSIIEKIGFEYKKNQANGVPPYGRGSSFSSSQNYHEIGDVCTRWKMIASDERNLIILQSVIENKYFKMILRLYSPEEYERIHLILSA